MAGRPSDEIVQEFAQDTLTLTTRQLSDKYQIAESTVSDWRLFCKRKLNLEVGYGRKAITFLDKKEDPEQVDDEEFWALMQKMSARRDKERKAQAELSLVLEDNLPYALAFVGDLHIGVEGVLYQELDEDLTALAGVPGVAVIATGDYAHNPKARMRPGENLYRMIVPDPDQQYRMAMYQLSKLEGQLVGLIKGCHDDWDAQIAGYERVAYMARQLNTAYLGHGATVTVRLGDQEYRILARHKYKYESSVNITNTQRRAWEQIGQPDAIVFGHLHHTLSHKEPRGNKDVIYMRSGSYFKWDEFGMKIGHYQGQRGIPMLVMYPDKHKMVPFYGGDMVEGLRFLEQERAYYRK